MTNQASEDGKTARQILIEYSNQFINPMLTELEPELDLVEALEGVEAIIRTEKLKLLDEVIHQSTVNLKSAKAVAGWAELRKEQLEAEL